jgi:hypothetical protein
MSDLKSRISTGFTAVAISGDLMYVGVLGDGCVSESLDRHEPDRAAHAPGIDDGFSSSRPDR